MTAVVDITRKRGDTRRHTFTIKDKDGNIVDISSWSAFVLAVNSDSEPSDVTNEIGKITGALTTDGSDGKVHFIPPGTWAVESYFYDAQALDANGEKVTFVEGKYKIEQDIAKD